MTCGTMRRLTAKANLHEPYSQQIITACQLFDQPRKKFKLNIGACWQVDSACSWQCSSSLSASNKSTTQKLKSKKVYFCELLTCDKIWSFDEWSLYVWYFQVFAWSSILPSFWNIWRGWINVTPRSISDYYLSCVTGVFLITQYLKTTEIFEHIAPDTKKT